MSRSQGESVPGVGRIKNRDGVWRGHGGLVGARTRTGGGAAGEAARLAGWLGELALGL